MAYINLDSLMVSYEYAKTLQEAWMNKMESSQATINAKRRNVENETEGIPRKIENNAFFDRAKRVSRVASSSFSRNIRSLIRGSLTRAIAGEEAVMNQRLRDTILHYVDQYNRR